MADRHQFRANWHDYNDGIYFVTICAAEKAHKFGCIKNGEMCLSALGRIVNDCLEEIPNHHAGTELLNYIVMPNHIHMVIAITSPTVGTRYIASAMTSAVTSAMTPAVTSAMTESKRDTAADNIIQTAPQSTNNGCLRHSRHGDTCDNFHHNSALSRIVGSFKAAVTRMANQQLAGGCDGLGGRDVSRPYWQSRYHEHIIRNQRAFENIMYYIDTNVERWNSDCFNNHKL